MDRLISLSLMIFFFTPQTLLFAQSESDAEVPLFKWLGEWDSKVT